MDIFVNFRRKRPQNTTKCSQNTTKRHKTPQKCGEKPTKHHNTFGTETGMDPN